MQNLWTKLMHRWNIYSPSQRAAILTFAALIFVLPFTALLVQKNTEHRSRAAVNEIPVTAPITRPGNTRASLGCTPSTGTYKTGDKFTVDMILDTHGYPVFGADIVASYSPSQLEAIGSALTPITQVTNWALPTTNTIDQPLGKIRLDYGKNQPAFTGNAPIGQVEFRVKDPGQTQFNYVFFQQYDNTSANGNVARVWGSTDGVNRINSLTDITNCIYVTGQNTKPILKLQLVNPGQIIKVGDIFDVNVLINTAGQKALAADAFISFDSSKIKIDPPNVRNRNYFDVFLSNHPQDRTTSLRQDNKLLMSAWQSSDLNPKSTTNDALFATMTTKAVAEGSTAITFDCTSGTADSNIFNDQQADIIKCPLQPLTLNIIGNSPTSILTPIPITAVIQPSPTSVIYPQSYPTPTPFIPPPTQIIFPTAKIPPTYPPSDLRVTFPPTVSPTPLENVVFVRETPKPTPRPAGGLFFTLLRNLLVLIFGGK